MSLSERKCSSFKMLSSSTRSTWVAMISSDFILLKILSFSSVVELIMFESSDV